VHDFFTSLFTGELIVPPSIEVACDSLLDSLVANFDDEELPYRREERMLELIKEEDGDKDAARARFDAEADIHQSSTNFAAVLTSSAMTPEQLGATRATQRYAVARSREWIIAAHNDLVARDRLELPRQAELRIASWSGTSSDGSNEKVLAAGVREHYDAKIDEAVNAVSLTPAAWIVLVAGVAIGGLVMTGGGSSIGIGLVLIAAAAAFFYWKFADLDRQRSAARQAIEKEHDQAAAVLKATLAELADHRREVGAEDARSAEVTTLLESLSSPQFVLQRPEQRVFVA
jgi:preprotein translocase subunit Sec61beta